MSGFEDYLLGRLDGAAHGPLVVLLGGMHGNEPAGVIAVSKCFEQLGRGGEGVLSRGRLLGLIGNPAAFAQNTRQVDEDLNRAFLPETLERPSATSEAAFAKTILALLEAEVAEYAPTELILLDLHTTSADGGDFIVLGDGPNSEPLTRDLGVPVVLGLTDVLHGTLCGYLTEAVTGIPTRTFAYEAGAHAGPESPGRAYALIGELLMKLGLVKKLALGERVDLHGNDVGRPPLTRVFFRLAIPSGGEFVMMPGFRNFDEVQAGQVVAVLDGESVALEEDGYMLMPLYQGEGRDGFFLAR